jgi:hypothetical protein
VSLKAAIKRLTKQWHVTVIHHYCWPRLSSSGFAGEVGQEPGVRSSEAESCSTLDHVLLLLPLSSILVPHIAESLFQGKQSP